jgi:hypothetical protein
MTRVEIVGNNTPGEVTFLVPATLSPGSYTLVVQAALKGKERQGNSRQRLACISPKRRPFLALMLPLILRDCSPQYQVCDVLEQVILDIR